jgi:ribosome-associated protein
VKRLAETASILFTCQDGRLRKLRDKKQLVTGYAILHQQRIQRINPIVMPNITFTLNKEFIALCDLLKATGIAQSGGHGKAMVADGLVLVDGTREQRKARKIRAGQVVITGDVRIAVEAEQPAH